MSDAIKEPAERPATVDDVVNDALGSSRGVLVGRALDDKALLAKYELDDLEVVFAMRDTGGEIIREKEPCYECLAEGFYGSGMHGTWYQEGATIVLSTTPNEQLRPLNRAAGIAYASWLESLPQNRTYIDIGDMSEAAVILAKDPRVALMSQAQAQRCTIAVAEGLKLKRDPHARDLRASDINRNFAPASGGKAPPMLNAKMSDLSQIGPGMTRNVATVTGPGAGVRRAANPLGGPPPGR
jgi:hypothetical protein